jgi:DNA repair protein RadC
MRLKMNSSSQKWRHPGGKLRELGPESLTDAELLAIVISSGIKDKPAERIADEILAKFGSFKGMANQPLHKFLEIKGLGDVKIIRVSAAFEIARRTEKEADPFFHLQKEQRGAIKGKTNES